VGRPQPPGRSDVTLRLRPTGVACLPDEASSTPAGAHQVHCDGHESLKSFGGLLTAQGSQPGAPRCEAGPEYHHGEAFSPLAHRGLSWTGSHAERRQSPFSPIRNGRPVFAGASDDPSMPATSVAILSLLPPAAAPFWSGARAERAAFSPLARVAAQSAPSPNHSP
jgi:hypothetical protein